jgi:hypothetical protein
MNDQLIFVRRKNRTTNHKTYNSAVIKMECPSGRFVISQKMATLLNVDNDDGLMFAFNKTKRKAYVCVDNDCDAFILRRKNKNSLRFSACDLMTYFCDVYSIDMKNSQTYHFKISNISNDNKMHLLELC